MKCSKLIEYLVQQANTFNPTVELNCIVDRFARLDNDILALYTAEGDIHYTRTIIVAVGRGIAEIQKLELQEPIQYEHENLHYTVQNPEHFSGKRVLISGGGNSAVDWAIELAQLARSVVVVHRKNEFRAMERNVSEMNNVTDVRTLYSITRLHNHGERIHQVVITHMESQENVLLDVDEVVVSHGYKSNLSDLASCGLEMDDGMVLMSHHALTNLPGIFAAGDCATHDSKVRLIAGAFNDAILAVNSAKKYLIPDAPMMAYVSSHNEIFREKNKQIPRF